MSSAEEEAIAKLYAQRQELLRQLSEINSIIRSMEHQMNEKGAQNGAKMHVDDTVVGCTDAERASSVLDSCLGDANGLRDAVKLIDAFKSLRESTVEGEINVQKHRFCNTFIHEMISRAHILMLDPNGSELIMHALTLLKNGETLPPSLYSNDDGTKPDDKFSEILFLLSNIKDHIEEVCCDTNGTRVMQKLLDSLKTIEEVLFCAQCFSNSIIQLCKDINGSHTVVRLLAAARFPFLTEENNEVSDNDKNKIILIHQLLYDKFAEHCVDVCKNRQGCCIIQKCLQWAPEPYFSTIIGIVLENTLKLVHDPFGNYVIQFILDHEEELSQRANQNSETTNYTNQIIRQMLHNVASLSCDKFSSNVIEKCLKIASTDVRQLLVDELTDPQVLPKLLTDGFANYVIQTAIATSSEETQFAQLRNSILPLQNLLKNSPYGVKVEAKLARRHRELVRKQYQQKQQARRGTVPSQHAEHSGNEAAIMGAQFFHGMQPIQTVTENKNLDQQTVTFSNVPKNIPSMITQPSYMPFMFQGQQTLIGLQGNSHQPFQVNMMKEGAFWGHPSPGITLFQNPNQRQEDR
ncbi:putative pumilio/PUF RNA binding protein 1 [Trypanosoma theileri]|uniref:Putative pumilio/PUF RNA binding protein 1 n=1 Tax=Trypanosoma theileri TaxID=67003 RepID=A0A1X0P8D8_9TRYP|nr:putative pumilio/PUF RNA binding protein 1 [Trypanosoma theileri]ORC93217.1 putative pumilio/PUF RNA binding protein 1 [Trypanosoma theileri]